MSFDSILQVLDEILYQSERILVRKLETPFYGDRANQPIPSVPDEIEKKSFHQKSKKEQRKETIWQRLGQLVASCPETTAAASHATVERRTTRIREDRVRSSISDASSRGNGTKCVRRIVDRHGKKIAVAQSDIEAESLDSILDDGETVVVFFRRSSYSFERSQ
ncbi:hypothetical protein V1477_004672 [Vespula maculifrons]|uniref:Uncharacterized protein n=2 Tax=Vespula TaxID=7451 RepID=A0A834NMM6_VESGE|nr:hypothetical protein HZH68_002565 [Vespula germanica]